jgi:hypothetical protein
VTKCLLDLQAAVEEMGVPQIESTREIFCNRTLNLRAIRAIGYDMDYTLIDYDVNQWEGRAYEYGAGADAVAASLVNDKLHLRWLQDDCTCH